MDLAQKLQRSRSTESIDFSAYQSVNQQDPLVQIENTDKILIEPCWVIPNDWEGQRYRDYIAEHPTYDGVFVRSELATRLLAASEALPEGLQLVIRAGHRPVEVQRRLLSDCAADFMLENPGASKDEALKHARTFVSDPDISLPPHVCGAAVDVCVTDTRSGELLDFGTRINDDNKKSFLYCPDLSDVQKQNRLILVTVMLNAGFASNKYEWWHFSYGDQVWAWFYDHKASLYSPVDL